MPEEITMAQSRFEKTAGAEPEKTPDRWKLWVLSAVCAAAALAMLCGLALVGGSGRVAATGGASDAAIMDKFDMYITNQASNALDGILDIKKVYWLSDTDLVAPEPNPANYGTANTPAELSWLLEEAAELIGGQEMLFGPDTRIWDGEPIRYYYDETILVITWKEWIGRSMYTFSEVKIAHPSQFRRFLANGEFGSDKQYVTTEMAKSVNAVVASSGDFYKFRQNGIVVHEGQIKRAELEKIDTCFIDDKGDLIFSPKGQFSTLEEAQQFVEEHNIRFSLAFGPILIEDGVDCVPRKYPLGEISGTYSRIALCQLGQQHYLLANATAQLVSQIPTDMRTFTNVLLGYGVEKAYALDGGQTTVIAMDGQLITAVDFGHQRHISDIIYFATALPDGE